jgi:hypothetical protein
MAKYMSLPVLLDIIERQNIAWLLAQYNSTFGDFLMPIVATQTQT